MENKTRSEKSVSDAISNDCMISLNTMIGFFTLLVSFFFFHNFLEVFNKLME